MQTNLNLSIRLVSGALFVASFCVAVSNASDSTYILSIPLGLIEPDIPKESPLTEQAVKLGEKIFFDKRLSSPPGMSCGTCHDPSHGFAEERSISLDAQSKRLRRNAPSILNSGYLTSLGWDGKFKSLEAQVIEPFSENGDFRISIEEVLLRIEQFPDYDGLFIEAFGGGLSAASIARALASYERSLVSAGTAFDKYLFGNDESALTAAEKRGFQLFTGKASCIACHDVFHPLTNPLGGQIATFTDNRFHNLGVGYSNGKMPDAGRYYVSRDKADWGAFKTPSLRNVQLTAPYMHDGSLATLEDVVEFYNKGGTSNPNLSPGIGPLYLNSQEKADLVSFLKSLTDPTYLEPYSMR